MVRPFYRKNGAPANVRCRTLPVSMPRQGSTPGGHKVRRLMNLNGITVYAGGEFRAYGDAKVGLLTHGLQYGTGCFEGIRGYWVAKESEMMLVQLREHYERLAISAKILMMQLPMSTQELVDLTVDLVARNRFEQNIYIRPCIFKAAEDIGVRLHGVADAFAIIPVPYTPYFDAAAGLKAGVSSWRRADDSAAPPRAKITGLYVNSALAKSEAVSNGFDEAIMLSHDGHLAEGSAENIFMVKGDVLYTPDASQNILEGCTRRSIIEIARGEFGIDVVERSIDRSELYGAQEVFFTGTAAGVVHVSSIDHRAVGDGSIGPVTQKLSEFYLRAVTGREPRYESWLSRVYSGRKVTA